MKTHSLLRGCGWRLPGAAYLMTHVSRYGDVPWQAFLYDPIPRLEDYGINMSPQELAIVPSLDARRTYDVWDWVGAGSYPSDKGYWYPTDYIEEGIRYDFSTRIGTSFIKAHIARLTSKSRLVKVHPHVPRNPQMWLNRIAGCPKEIAEHAPNGDLRFFTCAGMMWETVMEGTQGNGREVERAFPAEHPMFTYSAFQPVVDPEYSPGPFMWMPIHDLEIIWAQDGAHEKAIELLNKSGNNLPYRVVEQ